MTELSLAAAKTIIETAIVKGREMGLNPLSVVVLDTGGRIKAFEREDGATPGRFASAQGEAYGSSMLGMAGTAQMARAEQQAYFMAADNGAYGGQVIPVPGDVLVRDPSGAVVGPLV